MKVTGKKFIILILYTPTENNKSENNKFNVPVEGRTRFVKMAFLFDKELKKFFHKINDVEVELPEFFAWHYGPFSKELFNDLEFLRNRGYVEVQTGKGAPSSAELAEYMDWIEDVYDGIDEYEYTSELFYLSEEKGIPKAIELWNNLNQQQQELLISFKSKLVNAPLRAIIEYVYKKYKDHGYIDESVIKDKIL